MGLPDVHKPDGTEIDPHLEMRRPFRLFAGVLPDDQGGTSRTRDVAEAVIDVLGWIRRRATDHIISFSSYQLTCPYPCATVRTGRTTMKLALIGAGGKMGVRLARNLVNSPYEVAYVEKADVGRERLKEAIGADCVELDEAIKGARAVILAVPDTAIGAVAKIVVPQIEPGTMVIALDAAAPHAGHLPERADITYFVTHPCHPPIFCDEPKTEALHDHFGGIAAKQSIVNALMQGPEEHYTLGEDIAKTIWAPILRSHRVTVDQMALLEPGLSETVAATLLLAMRHAMDDVVRRGVDKTTARDFLLGHMNILSAVIFEEVDGVFSDACNKAIENAMPVLMQPGWLKVLEPEEINESIRRIT